MVLKKNNIVPGTLFSLLVSLIALSNRILRFEDSVSNHYFLFSFLFNFLYCIVSWEILYYSFYHFGKKANKHKKIIIGIVSVSITALFVYLFNYIFTHLFNEAIAFPEISNPFRIYSLLIRGYVLSSLFYFILLYQNNLEEKQRQLLEIEHLRQAQLEANITSLNQQLSPHFLFNTLNTLSSITNEKEVKLFVDVMASVYRYLLQHKTHTVTTLQEEIDFIQNYLYILKMRLEDAIDIQVDVSPHLLQTKIPPVTLQLLIENAIKHNVASSEQKLQIAIFSEADSHLIIRNNIQLKSSVPTSNGIGLENILQRYALLFSKEVEIDSSLKYFTVKLPIIA